MPRRTKIVLVCVVLVAGLLVAWQFRKPAVSTAVDASARTETALKPALQQQIAAPPLDLAAAPQPQTNPSPAPPSVAPSQATSASAITPDASPDHTVAGSASKPAESAVPELPANFSGVDRPNREAPSANRSDLSPDASDPATGQTHKIVDGDSLPLLAERYLGSASRAGEIFACNRDVLSDPELLPIGVRLRIPTGPPHVALTMNPPQDAATDATAKATTPQNESPNSVAPAQVAATPAKSAPLLDIGSAGLSPLPPIGERSASAGRIYIVQPGDTLPAIAQKLYGDSARTDAVLQANCEQLRSEQDLRPGMMLEGP